MPTLAKNQLKILQKLMIVRIIFGMYSETIIAPKISENWGLKINDVSNVLDFGAQGKGSRPPCSQHIPYENYILKVLRGCFESQK